MIIIPPPPPPPPPSDKPGRPGPAPPKPTPPQRPREAGRKRNVVQPKIPIDFEDGEVVGIPDPQKYDILVNHREAPYTKIGTTDRDAHFNQGDKRTRIGFIERNKHMPVAVGQAKPKHPAPHPGPHHGDGMYKRKKKKQLPEGPLVETPGWHHFRGSSLGCSCHNAEAILNTEKVVLAHTLLKAVMSKRLAAEPRIQGRDVYVLNRNNPDNPEDLDGTWGIDVYYGDDLEARRLIDFPGIGSGLGIPYHFDIGAHFPVPKVNAKGEVTEPVPARHPYAYAGWCSLPAFGSPWESTAPAISMGGPAGTIEEDP